jgi:serine/threonine-protein kinase
MGEKKRKLISYAIYTAILLFGILVGFIIFDRVLMPVYTKSGGTVSIPDVTGIPAGDAQQIAKKGGFEFRIMREEHSDSVPEGFVISQRPEPGAPAKKGRRISVVVSLSEAITTVPNVADVHIAKAILQIEQAGLRVRDTIYQNSDSIKNEMVIGTMPDIGEELIVGSSVDIIVSLGSERGLVVVPNFMGQNIDHAKELARSEGLFIVASYRRIPSVPENTVYRQDTEPSARVERGSTIYVVVAKSEGE